MQRIYYLTQTIDSAESVSQDLHEQGITDWNFHIVSKDEAGLYRHHLHSANAVQRTDVVRYMERGILVGAAVGLVAAIPITLMGMFNLIAWSAFCMFCMLFGAWCGGIGGISHDNYKIERFHTDIESGRYLIMVDVTLDNIMEIKKVMQNRHPEAVLQAIDSTVINPFEKPPKLAQAF